MGLSSSVHTPSLSVIVSFKCDSLCTLGPHGVFAYMFRSRRFDTWISLI